MTTLFFILVGLQGFVSIATIVARLSGRTETYRVMPRWMRRLLGAYAGITLYPLGIYVLPEVISRWDAPTARRIRLHEAIHARQQSEMLGLFFLWYAAEYLVRRMFADHRDAYRGISLEAEAYANDGDAGYLDRREPFAWEAYLGRRTCE